MTATESALLLMLCLLLTCIVEGKRKRNDDHNYECITNHLCGCGDEAIAKYETCWSKVEEATIDYEIERVKKLEMCKGFNGEMEKKPFKDLVTAYCDLPTADQKECYDDINKELMNRMRELSMSFDSKDHKEREGLEDCGMCAHPYVMSCRDSPTECV